MKRVIHCALRSLLVAVVTLQLASGAAHAGPHKRKPDPASRFRAEAEAHFQKGRELFAFGAYDDAIREYEAAYTLVPLPDLLFNIAQVYRTKGQRDQAIAYYRRYLEAAPHGDAADIARSHIAAMEEEIRTEREAAEARKRAEEAASRQRAAVEARRQRETEAAAREAARRAAEREAQARVAEAEAEQRRRTGHTLRLGGALTAGAGAISVGIGLYFGWRARSLSDEVSATTGAWTDELGQKVDDARSAERTMLVLTSVGGAVILGGGLLYYLGWRSGHGSPGHERDARVSLLPHGDGAMLVLDGGAW